MARANRGLEQQIAKIRESLPATSTMPIEQWAEAVRAVKDQQASPEQIGLVLGSELLVEREELVAECAVAIAVRRAHLVAADLISDLLAYPPDESPSEESLFTVRSSFDWKNLPVTGMDAYAMSTGIEIGEVMRRRHEGIEVALMMGDPMGMLLRRSVWLDHGTHWQPNPRICELAGNHYVEQARALYLVGEIYSLNRHRLEKAGIIEHIESRDTWPALELAQLLDQRLHDQPEGSEGQGGGTWSDLVKKGHGVPTPIVTKPA